MTTTPSPGAVVVGIDDSDGGRRALDTAASEALLSHRPLHVVHTWASYPTGYTAGDLPPHRHRAGRLHPGVRRQRAGHRGRPGPRGATRRWRSPTSWPPGDARQVLEDLSRDAAVLVVGSRGHGALKRMLLGSTSAWLARHAHSPLLVVRPSLDGEKRRVAVGTDGGHASAQALAYAYEAASRRGVPLTVAHCYDPIPRHVNDDDAVDLAPGEPEAVRRTLAEAVAGLAEKYPDVEVTLDGVPKSAVDHLVELSDHVGLVVVGSHRRSTLGRLTPPVHQPGRRRARPLHGRGGPRAGRVERPRSSGPRGARAGARARPACRRGSAARRGCRRPSRTSAGVRVSNSAASPGPRTTSCSPSTQAQPAVEDVEPVVALVALRVGLAPATACRRCSSL